MVVVERGMGGCQWEDTVVSVSTRHFIHDRRRLGMSDTARRARHVG